MSRKIMQRERDRRCERETEIERDEIERKRKKDRQKRMKRQNYVEELFRFSTQIYSLKNWYIVDVEDNAETHINIERVTKKSCFKNSIKRYIRRQFVKRENRL